MIISYDADGSEIFILFLKDSGYAPPPVGAPGASFAAWNYSVCTIYILYMEGKEKGRRDIE